MNTKMPRFGLLLVFAVVIVTVCTDSSHVDNHVGNGDNQEDNEDIEPENDYRNYGVYDSNKTAIAARISKKLMPVVVKPAGNMVRLKCPAEGNPVPNITWYKDGKTPISRNLGTIRSARWSITLEDLVVSDTANYTCDVCNAMGCVNFTYNLEVLERFPSRPSISKGYPQSQTVLINSKVQFECKTVSDLEPFIQWLKTDYLPDNNDQDPNFPNSTTVQTTITNPTSPEILQLHNVTFDDEGWYTCIASNSLGHVHATAYLKVVPVAEYKPDPPQTHPMLVNILAGVLCTMFFVSVIFIIYILKKLKREKKKNLIAIETARAAVVTQWTKEVIVENQTSSNSNNGSEPLLLPIVK